MIMEKQLTKAALTAYLKKIYVAGGEPCYDITRAIKATRYFSFKENLKSENPNEQQFKNSLEPLKCLFHFVGMNVENREFELQAAFMQGFLMSMQLRSAPLHRFSEYILDWLQDVDLFILQEIEKENQSENQCDDFEKTLKTL